MRMALPDVISGASGHSLLVDEVVVSVEVVAAQAVMVFETENATLPATIAHVMVIEVIAVINFFIIYFIDGLRFENLV
jgi:translation initiation factor 2 gamma subunit (eIF-2gamma)